MIILYDNFGRVKSNTTSSIYSIFVPSGYAFQIGKKYTVLEYLGVTLYKVECTSVIGGELLDIDFIVAWD